MGSKNIILLVVLSLLVISSGCVQQVSDQLNLDGVFNIGEDGEVSQNVTKEIIDIQEFKLSNSSINASEEAGISLKIRNPSQKSVEMFVEREGKNVLTNYCSDILRIKRFTVKKEGQRKSLGKLKLEEGEELEFIWKLKSREIPQELECDLQVMPEVESSSSAFSQIQFKKSKSVEDSGLDSDSERGGSLLIKVEPENKGSFIYGKKAGVDVFFKNIGEGDIEISEKDLRTEQEGLGGSCEKKYLFIGSGEVEEIQCEFRSGRMEEVSQLYEIYVESDYKYRTASEKKIVIKP